MLEQITKILTKMIDLEFIAQDNGLTPEQEVEYQFLKLCYERMLKNFIEIYLPTGKF